ncbi:hypothetical protein L1D44_02470 [Shewanella sp. Isolate13]|nr:hypothetical protein [Shewanella sp. Isolate13]MCG9728720.1 hypothetical protein [Shewanella sp. Isolate13]
MLSFFVWHQVSDNELVVIGCTRPFLDEMWARLINEEFNYNISCTVVL